MSMIGVWLLTTMCKASTVAAGGIGHTTTTGTISMNVNLFSALIELLMGDAAEGNLSLMEAVVTLMDFVLSSQAAQNCKLVTANMIPRIIDKFIQLHTKRFGETLFNVTCHITKGCAATNFLANPENWTTFKKLLNFAQTRNLEQQRVTDCITFLTDMVDRCDNAVLEEARNQKMEDGESVLVRVTKWFCKTYTEPRASKAQRVFLAMLLGFLCQYNASNLAIVKNVIENSIDKSVFGSIELMSSLTGRLNEMQRQEWAAKKEPCMCSEGHIRITEEVVRERNSLAMRISITASFFTE